MEDRGFQRFLDNVQYKTSGILRYERIFGEGYVSTGGIGEWCSPLLILVLIYDILFEIYLLYFKLSNRDYKRVRG
jgi:hypothetical protein